MSSVLMLASLMKRREVPSPDITLFMLLSGRVTSCLPDAKKINNPNKTVVNNVVLRLNETPDDSNHEGRILLRS